MCALSHSGFGGSRVAMSLYALEQGASQFTIGVLMALYAAVPLLLAMHLVIPLFFGSLGSAFGYPLVFTTNSGMLVAAGVLMRKTRLSSAPRAR